MTGYVLIVAHRDDAHARAVAAEIVSGGKSGAVILDSAYLPSRLRLNHRILNGDQQWSLDTPDVSLNADNLIGVWWRRPNKHRISVDIKQARHKRFCLQETRSAFLGWLQSLPSNLINDPGAESTANQKPYQLHCAADIGLKIPETIISNDKDYIGDWVENLGSKKAVFKILTTTPWSITETRMLTPTSLELLDNVKYAPVIFQEFIPRKRDLRVTIVDDDIFTVQISTEKEVAGVDWRLDYVADIAPANLPDTLEERLLEFQRSVGLRFGAIDIRQSSDDGEYYFLEVNPSGQFLFCEIHGDQKISRSLARALTS